MFFACCPIGLLESDRQILRPITFHVLSSLSKQFLWARCQMDMCDKSPPKKAYGKRSIWCARVISSLCVSADSVCNVSSVPSLFYPRASAEQTADVQSTGPSLFEQFLAFMTPDNTMVIKHTHLYEIKRTANNTYKKAGDRLTSDIYEKKMCISDPYTFSLKLV